MIKLPIDQPINEEIEIGVITVDELKQLLEQEDGKERAAKEDNRTRRNAT